MELITHGLLACGLSGISIMSIAKSGKPTGLPSNCAKSYASPWNHQVHSQTKNETLE